MSTENEYPKFVYDAQLRMFFKLRTASEEYYFMHHVAEAPIFITKEQHERGTCFRGIPAPPKANAKPVEDEFGVEFYEWFNKEAVFLFDLPNKLDIAVALLVSHNKWLAAKAKGQE